MNGFNENHKLRLRTTFKYVDESLSQVVQLLDASQAQSPFSNHIPDATPIQGRVISDYAARLRFQMLDIIEHSGISLPERRISTIWAARAVLSSIDIAIEEIKPQYMRGYGDLPQEAVQELDLIVAQLAEILGKMERYLAQGSGRDLHARLQKFETATDEARLLRELERIITSHGLLDLRPTLEMLVDRLGTSTFEVAVFGRVSSGKSSLLNYILQTDALPVGVTPVTTIPTRVIYGAVARATVWFAEASPITLEPSRLGEFVTEQQNPANVKHVSRIVVEVPSERLKDGITFVDTPGIGSLALGGAAESLAYLPRCDLGVVLIDAHSTVNHEDIILVDMLYRSGAQCMLLLSKADVLEPADREPSMAYLREQLHANLGVDVPMYWVSVKAEAAILCDQWVSQALQPCLMKHRQLAEASFRRKIGALREAVVTALKRKLSRPDKSGVDAGKWQQAEREIAIGIGRLDEARHLSPEWLQKPYTQSAQVLESIAHSAAITWNGDQGALRDLTPMLKEELARHGQYLAGEIIDSLMDLRRFLSQTLRIAAGAVGRDPEAEDALSMPAGAPVFDPLPNLNLNVQKPILAFLGRGLLYRHIRRQIEITFDEQLTGAFDDYGKRIEKWRLGELNELRNSFVAKAAACRALAGGSMSQSSADDSEEGAQGIADDLKALEGFNR